MMAAQGVVAVAIAIATGMVLGSCPAASAFVHGHGCTSLVVRHCERSERLHKLLYSC